MSVLRTGSGGAVAKTQWYGTFGKFSTFVTGSPTWPTLHALTPRAGDDQVEVRNSQGLLHLLSQSWGKWGWCVSGTSCGHFFSTWHTQNNHVHNVFVFLSLSCNRHFSHHILSPHILCSTTHPHSLTFVWWKALLFPHVQCIWFSPQKFSLLMFLGIGENTSWPPY